MWTLEIGDNLQFAVVVLGLGWAIAWWAVRRR